MGRNYPVCGASDVEGNLQFSIFAFSLEVNNFNRVWLPEYSFNNILRKKDSGRHSGQLIDLYGNQISWFRGIVWVIDGLSNAIGVLCGVTLLVWYLGAGGFMGCILLCAAPMFTRLLGKLNQVDTELSQINSKRLYNINDFLIKYREAKQMNFTTYLISRIKKERLRQSEILHKKVSCKLY